MRALVLFFALALTALARPSSASELLGTLKKVNDSGAIILGYRAQSLPFSFLSARGKPIGYSIDLCHEIIKDIRAELHLHSLNVKYVLVTPESRITAVKDGEIDLE